MPDDLSIWHRPAIGFVVEGDGEYRAYPSFASRLADGYADFPCINAGGCGTLVARLEEQLEDLISVYHPLTILVTVDQADLIEQFGFNTCEEGLRAMNERIAAWFLDHYEDKRLHPMPDSVNVVLQCPKLESWLIAHPEALHAQGLIKLESGFVAWEDVDTEVRNPASWLESRAIGYKPKTPTFQKACASASDLGVAELRSRSFRKFVKEVRLGFQRWTAIAYSTEPG